MIIRNSCSLRPPTDNIDVYYEAPTGQLVLGQTDVQGGLVELYGDMLSTGSGNINVLDGYGAINVINDTDYPLVTSGLSTGQGTAGLLKITDTGKEELSVSNPLHPEFLPLVTEYYRENGQVYTYSYYANPDGSVASVVSPPAQYYRPERRRPHGELSAGHRAVRLGGWARPFR